MDNDRLGRRDGVQPHLAHPYQTAAPLTPVGIGGAAAAAVLATYVAHSTQMAPADTNVGFRPCGEGKTIAPTYTSFTFFSGSVRTGLPVAAWIALSTAGATTQIVGSPTPPQNPPELTITVSTLGISASRMIS